MQILEPQKFASWNEPIEMLYACHGKVKRFCRQLTILPDYLAKNGCNQAVKNDVQQILNYFNQSAPLHHDDEEKDFFPLLVKYVPEAQKDIDELERQHVTLHGSWTKLSEQLQALLAGERENVDVALINHFQYKGGQGVTRADPGYRYATLIPASEPFPQHRGIVRAWHSTG